MTNVGALTGSNLFTVTGSGTIRVAMIANVGADSNTTLSSIQVSAVPEPSTYGLLGAGALAGVAFVRRRRKHSGKVAA